MTMTREVLQRPGAEDAMQSSLCTATQIVVRVFLAAFYTLWICSQSRRHAEDEETWGHLEHSGGRLWAVAEVFC